MKGELENMEQVYIIHKADKTSLIIKHSEAIQNALDQEAAGIKPEYKLRDYKTGKAITPPGWLIWSTLEDGAGVAHRRESDGKMILLTGWQGDFIYG